MRPRDPRRRRSAEVKIAGTPAVDDFVWGAAAVARWQEEVTMVL